MLILGIDPGLRKTGWGIVFSHGSTLQYRASGTIKTDPDESLAARLADIHRGIADIIAQWKPDAAAVEETFINKNAASALKLGQARGVALCAPAVCGLPVAEYSANKIKKSVVGTGHADKVQIAMMVRRLLPACGNLQADEADALAVAITHAHYSSMSFLRKQESGKVTATRSPPSRG